MPQAAFSVIFFRQIRVDPASGVPKQGEGGYIPPQ